MTYDDSLLISTMHCDQGTERFCTAKMGICSNIAARIKKKIMRCNRRRENKDSTKTNPNNSIAAGDDNISTAASRRNAEKKNKKNFLLKFPLSFPRKVEVAYKSQPGVTKLHRACLQALTPSVILLIMRSDKQRSADVPDFRGRLPLHILTIRICEGKMPL
jgi:hypothetical protein